MPWAAAGAVAAAGIGVGGSMSAAKKADKAAKAALGEQRRQFDATQARTQPWVDAGARALPELEDMARRFGKTPTAESVMADPGYQFALDEGRRGLEGSAAASGGLFSGAAGKALERYGQGHATKFYNDAFNRQQTSEGNQWGRFAGLAGIGQSATNQLNSAGANFANNASNIGMQNGANQANAGIATSNIIGGAVSQLGSMAGQGKFGNWGSGAPAAYAENPVPSFGYQEPYAGGDTGVRGGFADGGPVLAPDQPASGASAPKRPMSALDRLRALLNPKDRVAAAEKKALGYADGGAVYDEVMGDDGFDQLPPKVQQLYDAWASGGEGYADGGAVQYARPEPRIGSRSPLPGATAGGPMSTENIMLQMMLQERMRQQALAASGAASAPPANFLMKPTARTEEELRRMGLARGGEVDGPGGPRDDAIPAWLSDGEHVVDEKAVTGFGRGSNARGQKKLNRLREVMRQGRV